ncbi:MAG: hypothetical protein UX47_C0004G0048 [Candidatus Collierbacteria bacterium GW2011_GWA2_46_26]|uniref:Uncharacterized protein n=1 Tax=Candidatus Collierbacteria bacterium GW2011_GWA2_46_26 TaxID=1618381 RepID=A0A0G1RTV0_9BACT|nr:MAG: hypothetical protein UX47_C0004G0048 [Candidatus Collierbacteria bacterium GW2011_GWA2_46_26]
MSDQFMSYQGYSGPCTFKVQGPNSLFYKGVANNNAQVFTVPGVGTVSIYDFRPNTIRAVSTAVLTGDFGPVIKAFKQTASVTVSQEAGHFYIEVEPINSWFLRFLAWLGSKKTIWISTNVGQSLPIKSYLFCEHFRARGHRFSVFSLYTR